MVNDPDVWTYYRGLVDEILPPNKPAKPIPEQHADMVKKLSADIAAAITLLNRIRATLRPMASKIEGQGISELLTDIDDFRESIQTQWHE